MKNQQKQKKKKKKKAKEEEKEKKAKTSIFEAIQMWKIILLKKKNLENTMEGKVLFENGEQNIWSHLVIFYL